MTFLCKMHSQLVDLDQSMKYWRVVLSDSSNNKTTHCLKNLYLYERSLGDDSFKNLVK